MNIKLRDVNDAAALSCAARSALRVFQKNLIASDPDVREDWVNALEYLESAASAATLNMLKDAIRPAGDVFREEEAIAKAVWTITEFAQRLASDPRLPATTRLGLLIAATNALRPVAALGDAVSVSGDNP